MRLKAVVAGLCLAAAGCGQKGPPLAPLHLVPAAVSDVSLRRVGDRAELQFTLPTQNANGPGRLELDHVEIYAITAPPGVTPPNRLLLTEKQLVGRIAVRPPLEEGESPKEGDTRPGPGDRVRFIEDLTADALVPAKIEVEPDEAKPAAPAAAKPGAKPAAPQPAAKESTPEGATQQPATPDATPGEPQPDAKESAPKAATQQPATPPAQEPAPDAAVAPATEPHAKPAESQPDAKESAPEAATQQPATPGAKPSEPQRDAQEPSAESATQEPAAPTTAPTGAPATVSEAAGAPASQAPAAASKPPVPKAPVRVYAVRGVTRSGRFGPPSPRVQFIVAPPPPPPATVSAQVTEKAVVLEWAPSADAAQASFNVYLSADPMRPLNASPLTTPRFEYAAMKFGVEYCFAVRSVSAAEGAPVEGELSAETCVTPRDTFAPAAPTGLAAVPTAGQINLIWDANTEPDIGGYIVLRGEAPDGMLQPITPKPIRENSYSDTTVKPGTRYVYAIVAVDSAEPPNTSEQSARVEETAR